MEEVRLGEKDIFFTLKDIAYLPEAPRMNEAFKVIGKIQLFKIPFIGPIWVIATVTYPEKWWEEIIPIWGSPERRESATALGANFEITYPRGFDREGVFSLVVRAYAGPTMPLDSLTLPPFPPVSTYETTFTVAGEAPELPTAFRFSRVTIDGNSILLTDKDADAGLLLEKTTADYLDITPNFEWTGPKMSATISVKAGHRTLIGTFNPKTGAYTKSIILPESEVTYSGEVETIRVPLTACGGLTDGAVEIVAKLAGMPDYISRIWNVYATKEAAEKAVEVQSLSLS